MESLQEIHGILASIPWHLYRNPRDSSKNARAPSRNRNSSRNRMNSSGDSKDFPLQSKESQQEFKEFHCWLGRRDPSRTPRNSSRDSKESGANCMGLHTSSSYAEPHWGPSLGPNVVPSKPDTPLTELDIMLGTHGYTHGYIYGYGNPWI